MIHANPRKRNTKRGIRSKLKIEEGRLKRSFKRREARRHNRKEGKAKEQQTHNKPNSDSAQEPLRQIQEIELGKEVHIATLNIGGTSKMGVREEIEN
jgi:hypothetical protein